MQAPSGQPPAMANGECSFTAKIQCPSCLRARPVYRMWWHSGTKTCEDCMPDAPMAAISIEQDRRDEAAEMSWIHLAGRW